MKLRTRPNLGRDLVLVLAGKSLALLVIWSAWFAHPQAPELDAERVRAALYSSHSPEQQRTDPHAQP